MAETFFITTAIDYTNGAPHIGHAYEKVLADVLARFRRLKGQEVFFLTGVDQHGQKVQQSAEKQGVAPQEFVDGITSKFVALWEKLDARYDGWAATTAPTHKDCVRAILQRLWDDQDPATGASKWIYKKTQRGFYSVRQEQFLTDKERNAEGEFGPEWGQVEERDEENYYFRLAEYRPWLLDLIDRRSAAGRPLVLPEFRVAELRNAVEKLDGDLCITRPKARLSWGIPVPFDEAFVTFVWFDALVNYISFAPAYAPQPTTPPTDFLRWWTHAPGQANGVVHVIGKDILIPAHGVYWPIMLKALGFTDEDMPTLLVHGWWNIAGGKMSKSLGNVVDPDVLADKYGPEAVRYYLMSDIATGRDADFSEERLIQRFNADLANSLGNLLNRSLNMAAKYRNGSLQATSASTAFRPAGAPETDPEIRIPEDIEAAVKTYTAELDTYRPDAALSAALAIATIVNRYIDVSAPWKLAKDPANADELSAVLYRLAESLRILAILISPVLPKAAHGLFDQLNWKTDLAGREERFSLADAQWGGLPDGHTLGQPTPLFPRLEPPPAE